MKVCSRTCGVLPFPREPRALFYYAGLSVRGPCVGEAVMDSGGSVGPQSLS